MGKLTEAKKKDFIDTLMSMTPNEINEYIKKNGKRKDIVMCVFIDKKVGDVNERATQKD